MKIKIEKIRGDLNISRAKSIILANLVMKLTDCHSLGPIGPEWLKIEVRYMVNRGHFMNFWYKIIVLKYDKYIYILKYVNY